MQQTPETATLLHISQGSEFRIRAVDPPGSAAHRARRYFTLCSVLSPVHVVDTVDKHAL